MPVSTKQNKTTARREPIIVSARARELYEKRDRSLDNDPETRPASPDEWEKYGWRGPFRVPKVQTTVRLDVDVLEWLKSKGPGHIARVNAELRAAMLAERRAEILAERRSK